MKRTLLLLLLVALSFGYLSAQNLVSTVAENKKLILEEFTGINCGNCPGGHTIAKSILDANPGTAFVIGLHPFNSSYTSGTPDFRRSYADAFYSTPYVGNGRFMPSAMTNRREFNGEKIQSRGSWMSNGNSIMAEASPVNVGMEAIYDPARDTLLINVEVYFTGAVTDAVTLYVMMTEDSLVGYQASGGSNYVHKHVFREPFCAQWGDPIATSNMGDMHSYSFTLPAVAATGYIMKNCNVLAYVVNSTNEEILSGNGSEVVEGQLNTSNDPRISLNLFDMQVAPNPFSGTAKVNYYLDTPGSVHVSMTDLVGKTVFTAPAEAGQRGKNTFTLDAENAGLGTGVYLLHLRNGDQTISKKVVLY